MPILKLPSDTLGLISSYLDTIHTSILYKTLIKTNKFKHSELEIIIQYAFPILHQYTKHSHQQQASSTTTITTITKKVSENQPLQELSEISFLLYLNNLLKQLRSKILSNSIPSLENKKHFHQIEIYINQLEKIIHDFLYKKTIRQIDLSNFLIYLYDLTCTIGNLLSNFYISSKALNDSYQLIFTNLTFLRKVQETLLMNYDINILVNEYPILGFLTFLKNIENLEDINFCNYYVKDFYYCSYGNAFTNLEIIRISEFEILNLDILNCFIYTFMNKNNKIKQVHLWIENTKHLNNLFFKNFKQFLSCLGNSTVELLFIKSNVVDKEEEIINLLNQSSQQEIIKKEEINSKVFLLEIIKYLNECNNLPKKIMLEGNILSNINAVTNNMSFLTQKENNEWNGKINFIYRLESFTCLGNVFQLICNYLQPLNEYKQLFKEENNNLKSLTINNLEYLYLFLDQNIDNLETLNLLGDLNNLNHESYLKLQQSFSKLKKLENLNLEIKNNQLISGYSIFGSINSNIKKVVFKNIENNYILGTLIEGIKKQSKSLQKLIILEKHTLQQQDELVTQTNEMILQNFTTMTLTWIQDKLIEDLVIHIQSQIFLKEIFTKMIQGYLHFKYELQFIQIKKMNNQYILLFQFKYLKNYKIELIYYINNLYNDLENIIPLIGIYCNNRNPFGLIYRFINALQFTGTVTFSKTCLQSICCGGVSLKMRVQQQQQQPLCSQCKQDHDLDEYATVSCSCGIFLCDFHKKVHNKLNPNHILSLMNQQQLNPLCEIHKLEKKIYCKTCPALICSECIVANQHINHEMVLINDVKLEEQQTVLKMLNDLKNNLNNWNYQNVTTIELDNELKLIENQHQICQLELEKARKSLKESIDIRIDCLLKELDQLTIEKKEIINNIKGMNDKILKKCEELKINEMSTYDLINEKLTNLEQLRLKLNELLQKNIIINEQHEFEIVDFNYNLIEEQIQKLGQLTENVIDLNKSQLVMINEKDYYCCKDKIICNLIFKNKLGKEMELKNVEHLKCQLLNKNEIILTPKKINNQKKYELTFEIPETKDDCLKLSVIYNDKHICNSPLNLNINHGYSWDLTTKPASAIINEKTVTIQNIANYSYYRVRIMPKIHLNHEIQFIRIKIDKEPNYSYLGILNANVWPFVNNNCRTNGYTFKSYRSHSSSTLCNDVGSDQGYSNFSFGEGHIVRLEVTRGNFKIINESKGIEASCKIPQDWNEIYFLAGFDCAGHQYTLLN